MLMSTFWKLKLELWQQQVIEKFVFHGFSKSVNLPQNGGDIDFIVLPFWIDFSFLQLNN